MQFGNNIFSTFFPGHLDVISSKMKNFGGLPPNIRGNPPKKFWRVASPALAYSIDHTKTHHSCIVSVPSMFPTPPPPLPGTTYVSPYTRTPLRTSPRRSPCPSSKATTTRSSYLWRSTVWSVSFSLPWSRGPSSGCLVTRVICRVIAAGGKLSWG